MAATVGHEMNYLHVERLHSFRHLTSDSTETDDGQGLAVEFFAHEGRALPGARLQRRAGVGDAPMQDKDR